MKPDLDSLIKNYNEAREQLKFYSSQLGRQTRQASEMKALISELEAQLNCRAEVIEGLRASSPGPIDGPTQEVFADAQTVGERTPVDPDVLASLIALPMQVPIGGAVGFTEITWDSGDGSEGEVYVSVDGEAETLFATGPRGSKPAPWIVVGQSYEFKLYSGTDHDRVLKQVRVVGKQIPLPNAREVIHGVLDTPEQYPHPEFSIKVSGWAYSKVAPIAWVEARVGDVPLGLLSYGLWRSDVKTESDFSASSDCGFFGVFLLTESLNSSAKLRVRVADEQGNIREFEAGAFTPLTADHGTANLALPASHWQNTLSASKSAAVAIAQMSLDSFLAANSIIEFPRCQKPQVSVVLVLYNRSELTLECLYSILTNNNNSYEVIIVDNASTDRTPRLLKQVRNAKILRNEANLHFLRACNQAVERAEGRYILFLNNDARILPGSIASAVRTLDSAEDIGAVGAKIVLPDGTLQEAGSIIWRDGSCLGYGRGDSPTASSYMFQRDVDYCSGAFLLTKRHLFIESGGFDPIYSPAYYEETDYCVKLWKRGKRIVYDPRAIVFHYEFASSNSAADAIDLQVANRETFVEKHRSWLGSQHSDVSEILFAREHARAGQKRILMLDDRVPHTTLGAGFPRSNTILRQLVDLGHSVTFYPLLWPREDWAEVYSDIPVQVEVVLEFGLERLNQFLAQRRDFYDIMIVSRPHNMASIKAMLSQNPGIFGRSKIIYDAEALDSYREIERHRIEGRQLSALEQKQLTENEVRLAETCDAVITVSDREGQTFLQNGFPRVYTLGHSLRAAPTATSFEDRSGLLFVGAINFDTSPNADSIVWFSENVLPLIREMAGAEIKLFVAGVICHGFRTRVGNSSVEFLGKVDDLNPWYDRARIFVAPTRFAAGLPHKVCEAAAQGLPSVATSLLGSQLGWTNEREILLADDEHNFASACVRLYRDSFLWNRLRENALDRVRTDFSPDDFSQQLQRIIE